jgi:hypothetical protein
MVVTEIEFRNIAVKMLLAAMLIDAFHAAFEDAVETLKSVCVNGAVTIFASAMIDIFVAREILVQMRVLTSFEDSFAMLARRIGTKGAADVPST